MNPLKDIFRLFFPSVCPVCSEPTSDGEAFICTRCRWDIPLTGYWKEGENPVEEMFWGHLPVARASAFMFFIGESRFRKMVHGFKYHGQWRVALRMGQWYGVELKDSGLYNDVDIVVPIPLHMRKRLIRGYNQSEYLAQGIAQSLERPMDTRSVARKVHNKSQSQRHKLERWDNVKDIFTVRDPSTINGKHILLVDDVLTTGATIISCAEAIVAAAPGCRLSIATLAVSKSELDTRRRKKAAKAMKA